MVGPQLNTTSTKKRQAKVTKAEQDELEQRWRDRNQTLKEMHLPKETFEQFKDFIYGRGKKTKGVWETRKTSQATLPARTKNMESNQASNTNTYTPTRIIRDFGERCKSLPDNSTGACSSKPSPTYTGEKMIGISQMAKSNAVPVFNSEAITDIARMRR